MDDPCRLTAPVAPGPAPHGLASTGDASFCAPSDYAGVPAIALPSRRAANGLPHWVEALLAFRGEPPPLPWSRPG